MVKGKAKTPRIRRAWLINPKTRVKKSTKRYDRTGIKKELKHILKGTGDEEGT